MIDELSAYLSVSTSPEFEQNITEALLLFDEYGLNDIEVNYLDILITADHRDPNTLTDEIESLTIKYQDTILEQLRVRMDEDASLKETNIVLSGLKLIESTELTEEILNTLDSIRDPHEALCEIISLLTGQLVESIYPTIEWVDESVLKAIRLQMEEFNPVEFNEYSDKVIKKRFERFNAFKSFIPREYLIEAVLGENIQLETPFSIYYNTFKESLITLPAPEQAAELVAMSMIAEDTMNNPRAIIQNNLNTTYTSISAITPILQNVEQLLLKFQQRQTSGIREVKT